MPGLAAKPVIDIVVAIDDVDDEPAYAADLEDAGYELRVREPATGASAAAAQKSR